MFLLDILSQCLVPSITIKGSSYLLVPLHGKPHFLFPDVLKRWSSQKKLCWNMIFLVLSGKMIFLFPENMILHLRRKMKDDLSQKNTRKYDIFFKCSEKMVFSKGIALGFFPRKHDIFSLEGKWGMFFFKKYTGVWTFLCIVTDVTNMMPRSSVKKKQRWSYPAKIHLRVIDVLDRHSRRSSSNSLYFHEDL